MSLVDRLAKRIDAIEQDRVLVAVDGSDAAGKTTFADRLAQAVRTPTYRVSIDSFLRPRHLRHQRGELSPEGYYLDSFDTDALVDRCLLPFRAGEPSVTASANGPSREPPGQQVALSPQAVLIVDGVFLLRGRLRELWHAAIYLRVSPEESLRRARRRDTAAFGWSFDEVERRYRGRYLPGQALYREDAKPEEAAHMLIDNEDPTSPILLKRTSFGPARR